MKKIIIIVAVILGVASFAGGIAIAAKYRPDYIGIEVASSEVIGIDGDIATINCENVYLCNKYGNTTKYSIKIPENVELKEGQKVSIKFVNDEPTLAVDHDIAKAKLKISAILIDLPIIAILCYFITYILLKNVKYAVIDTIIGVIGLILANTFLEGIGFLLVLGAIFGPALYKAFHKVYK